MSEFDDHPNVVVLEDVVRRLVLLQCLGTSNPAAAIENWQAFLKRKHDLFIHAAFNDPKVTPDTSLNAISIASQFEQFGSELAEDYAATDGG